MIQVDYKQSAVVSGWIVAPMALTAMLGKSSVIKILNKFGYRRVLMTNTIIIGCLICLLALPSINSSIYWFIPILACLGFFNSIQFTSMNTISIADLRNFQTSSGNSLISVNQQLSIGFGVALGLIILNTFQNSEKIISGGSHQAFRYTFLVVGILTIISGFVFRRLHPTDGNNMKTQEK
jgi:MFS family permease